MRVTARLSYNNCLKIGVYSDTPTRSLNGRDSKQIERRERDNIRSVEFAECLSRLKSLHPCIASMQSLGDVVDYVESIADAQGKWSEYDKALEVVRGYYRRSVLSDSATAPLTYSKNRNGNFPSDSKRPYFEEQGRGERFREKRFSGLARERFLEAGQMVSDRIPRSEQRFITLTLPGSLSEAFAVLADNSAYAVNRLMQFLRREGSVWYFWAWEFQKRGALHLHAILSPCPDSVGMIDMDSLAARFVDCWYGLLGELSDGSGIDLFAKNRYYSHRDKPKNWQSKVIVPQKDVSRYCSKYLSKNSSEKKRNHKESVRLFYPSRFWGMASSLKEELKGYRNSVSIGNLSEDDLNMVFACIVGVFDIVQDTESVMVSDFKYEYVEGSQYTFYLNHEKFLNGLHSRLFDCIRSLREHNTKTSVLRANISLEECRELCKKSRLGLLSNGYRKQNKTVDNL